MALRKQHSRTVAVPLPASAVGASLTRHNAINTARAPLTAPRASLIRAHEPLRNNQFRLNSGNCGKDMAAGKSGWKPDYPHSGTIHSLNCA
jgi:hypothetical protein